MATRRDGADDARSRYYQGDDLQAYLISRAVNSPDNESEEILESVDVDEQTSLEEF